ncbi:MAG: hypothetical protein JNM57_16710 [Cyclobacteriaceae bacterium]|nr:hypothetical protein [Cyclobacteriaceae bacterium]
MMATTAILHDRIHAAHLLGERLMAFRNTDAVVLGIPRGGVPVGYHLAKMLNLPFDIILCKKITHPGCAEKSIGSVSLDDVFISSESCRDVPQDYVGHQITLIRHSLAAQHNFYKGSTASLEVSHKTVILTDDVLTTADTMLAAVKSIRKKMPASIIVAVPVTTAEASVSLAQETDDFIFLMMESLGSPIGHGYENYPDITEDEVKELIGQTVNSKQST